MSEPVDKIDHLRFWNQQCIEANRAVKEALARGDMEDFERCQERFGVCAERFNRELKGMMDESPS